VRYMVKCGRSMMGTLVTITVEHPDVAEGKAIMNSALDEMCRIEELMSLYKESSEVSVLNRNGSYEGASTDTIEVIKRSNYCFELSDGAWDITILPLLKLWADRAHKNMIPTDAGISEALEFVNYRNIITEGNNIRFKKAGMGVTLAGIAKGYAIDRAIETLSQCGIGCALVNAGGDIRVMGRKADTTPWRVGVRNPKNRGQFAAVAELHNQAITTSGTYNRYSNDIIDVRTGKPAREIVSSNVITDRAIDADALSTCLFVLGVERGMKVIEDLGIAALVITRQGEIFKSDRWRQES